MDVFIEKRIEWHRFLVEYFKDANPYFSFSQYDNKLPYTFNLDKVFGSEITFTQRWGFLTIEFETNKEKKRFLKTAEINISIEKSHHRNPIKIIQTKYNRRKYPCRVYPRSSFFTIALYDDENVSKLLKNGKIEISEVIEYRKEILDTLTADLQKHLSAESTNKTKI